jgi:hypothetical protein
MQYIQINNDQYIRTKSYGFLIYSGDWHKGKTANNHTQKLARLWLLVDVFGMVHLT